MTRSPTLTTAIVLVCVYCIQFVVGLFGFGVTWFTLSQSVDFAPWTLVTSVYGHATPGHLVSNLVALVIFGLAVERTTTPLRFYLFFLVSGALAGLTEVSLMNVHVLGASGAVFALLGYALSSNTVTNGLLGRLSGRVQAIIFVLLAACVTLATAGPNVALIAHFTGLVIGLVAGRLRLLHVNEERSTDHRAVEM